MAEAAPTSPAPPESGAAPGVFIDPYRAYNFKLEIRGVTTGHFTECSGLGVRVQAIRYREGGNNQVIHVVPGQVEYDDVTLRYGLTASRELWDWLSSGVQGNVTRQNVSIIMVASNGTDEAMRYDLGNAWISAWRGAPLDALGQQLAIDTITLVFETLERQG
jgi:phage tail-like protein